MTRRSVGRAVLTVAVLALVLTAGAVLVRSSPERRVTAHFTAAVGVYPGSDVRVLGVKVGRIVDVRPEGPTVRVVMSYDASYAVPAGASAVIVPPSVVSDRYVQLTPAYTGGPTLADGADLGPDRTTAPVELDDIYRSLNDLNVALGPTGANAHGALATLLKVGRANLDGQGDQVHTTLENASKAVQTVSASRQDLFGTVTNLQQFTTALARSDRHMRDFNAQLATVSEQLDGERAELGAALRSLSVALEQVASFVRANRSDLVGNVDALTRLTAVLVKQRTALASALDDAPLALSNLNLAYNPSSGTLDTRDDALSGSDAPIQACSALAATHGFARAPDLQAVCGALVETLRACGLPVPAGLQPLLGTYPAATPLPCAPGPGVRPRSVPAQPAGPTSDPTLGGVLKAGG